jgi:hypothetical protein
MKFGATHPVWADSGTFPFVSAGGRRNLQVSWATTTKVTITADQIDAVDSSGTMCSLISPSLVPDISASGALGLDTGSVTIDKPYHEWILVKSDLSASTAVFSLSQALSGVTKPSGYTGCFGTRVGAALTLHTSTALLKFYQSDTDVWFDAEMQTASTSDGLMVLNAGTSTTYATVDISTRMPQTARQCYLGMEISPNASSSAMTVHIRPNGSSVTNAQVQVLSLTTNTMGSMQAFRVQLTGSDQKVQYKLTISGSSPRLFLYAQGYRDRL